ncbi:hypothetical protein BAE44_0004458, partial [Dichanthelium oligosanthes]
LPGCTTTCGNVTVPYPFGIGANCSLQGFNLACDGTHDPPRLLLDDGAVRVLRGAIYAEPHLQPVHPRERLQRVRRRRPQRRAVRPVVPPEQARRPNDKSCEF